MASLVARRCRVVFQNLVLLTALAPALAAQDVMGTGASDRPQFSGDSQAKAIQAERLFRGDVGLRRPQEAMRLLEQVVRSNDGVTGETWAGLAQQFGDLHLAGTVVPRSIFEAIWWYRAALRLGGSDFGQGRLQKAIAALRAGYLETPTGSSAERKRHAERSADTAALVESVARARTNSGEDSLDHALALAALADHHLNAGRDRNFIHVAHEAVAALERGMDPGASLEPVLSQMSEAHARLDECGEAVPLLRRQLELMAVSGRLRDRATVQYNLAWCLAKWGRANAEAEHLFGESLRTFNAVYATEAPDEALANVLDSWAHFLLKQLGDPVRALDVATQSLDITRQWPNTPRPKLIGRLDNVVIAATMAGASELAVTVAEESQRLHVGEFGAQHQKSGGQLSDLALAYLAEGRYALALSAAERGLSIVERATGADSALTGRVLNTLAEVQLAVGLLDRAWSSMQRAARIFERRPGQDNEALLKALINLSNVERSLGAVAASEASLDRALQLLKGATGSGELLQASAMANLAASLMTQAPGADLGSAGGGAGVAAQAMSDRAADLAQRSLDIREKRLARGHRDVRFSWTVVGMVKLARGDATGALAALHGALAEASSAPGDAPLKSLAEMMLSLAYAASGQEGLCIVWGKEAVNTLQGLRSQQYDMEPAMREILRAKQRATYETVASLLIGQGRLLEAQQILQMLKETELHDSTRGSTDDPRRSRAELTGLELQKFSRFYELRDQQAELGVLRRALERKATLGLLSGVERQQLDDIVKRHQPVLVQAMRQFIQQLESDLAESASPAVPNSLSVVRESTDLRQAVDRLAESEPRAGVVALQYLVGRNTLSIILTAPGGPPLAYQRRVDRAALYAEVARLSLRMQSAEADPALFEPALRELHGLLVDPVLDDLRRLGARTLMLSLDDKLRLLPFAALMSKAGRHLIQDFSIALYNEAAGQAMGRVGSKTWRVAALGVSDSVGGLPPLKAVADELAGILKLPGIEGESFLNRRFTRERMLQVVGQEGSRAYNVLHVASHFVLAPGRPAESWLYLGDGSRLSLTDLGAMGTLFSGFDLVTYSACQTATGGGRDSTGAEMESLSARTQRQGAEAVLATLWRISDQSTAQFMRTYYAQRLAGLNKAEALRSAQLAMISGQSRSQPEGSLWGAPHHWAGFVLSGNWR
jgi:CHAT domain-containing protein